MRYEVSGLNLKLADWSCFEMTISEEIANQDIYIA